MKTLLTFFLVGFSTYAQAESLESSIDCLAKNIYFEARSQSIKGQYAVGFVTINRLKSGKYANSICGVVYQYKQFSWTLAKDLVVNYKGEAWERAKNIAKSVLKYPKLYDHTKGALFYHTTTTKPTWSTNMVATSVIESHIFYKLN